MADCIKIHFDPKNMLLRPFLEGQNGPFINNISQLNGSDPALTDPALMVIDLDRGE
jgi:hypothetical protein